MNQVDAPQSSGTPRSENGPEPSNWNVPNGLSLVRLVLSLVVVYLIEATHYWEALVCFVIAASTDWVDGWWARKFNQCTKLGRILDPFVDKIIICGAMIAIAALPDSGLRPWMATLVVGRELLVTSLRSMIEGRGGDFSAKQLGKWKMVLQCAVVIMVLYQYSVAQIPSWFNTATNVTIWAMLLLTLLSGLQYVLIASRKSTE